MTGILDRLKNLGRGLLASMGEGTARAVASFAERYERQSSLVYEQRAHLPRGRYERLARQHMTGERAFASMMRGSGGMGWRVGWTQERARQVQFFRRWIYVGCDRICSTAAALPPKLAYVRTRRKRNRRGGAPVEKEKPNRRHGRAKRRLLQKYYEARYRKTLHAIKPHEEAEPVSDDHPLARLLKKPNAWDSSGGQLWYELILFLLLTGNAYLWLVPDAAFGRPLEAWVVPSQWVQGPKLGPAGEKFYQIVPYLGAGGVGIFTVPADEIVHFHFKNPLNKIDGWAPIQAIAPWIDVAESIDDSRYWTFKQGSQANGALQLGPKYDPDDIDIDTIGAKFLARYQGERNAGQPVILPPDVTFVPLTIAAKDMAFEGGFEQLRDSILAALAVPKGIAGITDPGSDRALWGERAVFYEQAILPRLRYIAEVFTAKVCRRWDDELVMYWEDPTPPDPQQVNADLGVDFAHGLRTPNEGRSARGLPPVDDPLMDEVWLPPNMQPLSAIRKQLEQQQQQAQQAAVQQQMQPQSPAAAEQPESMQQQQGQQADAEDAALDVNDRSWQNEGAAVQKAHEYNRLFSDRGMGWRLEREGTRWKACRRGAEKRIPAASRHAPSANGDGSCELVAAAAEFLRGG